MGRHEFAYQKAKRFYANTSAAGFWNAHSKTRRLASKVSIAAVAKDLCKQCSHNKRVHTCQDVFKARPQIVLLWRKLWYSIPKNDRFGKLVSAYANARLRQDDSFSHSSASDGFGMTYSVLGHKVCRQAFIHITAITAETLQSARHASMNTVQSSGGPLAVIYPKSLGRDLKYVSARSWLLEYAQTHGDTSPLTPCYFLPCGLKQFYWATYWTQEREKNSVNIAGLSLFCKVWQRELPFIKIRTSSTPFTACGLCQYLKMLAASQQEQVLREQVLHRLGHHYAFQGAQRLAVAALWRESERDQSDSTMLIIDKMDQSKTITPRVNALKATHFMKGGHRLVVGLVGCLLPLWHRPIMLTVLEDVEHGSDMQCSSLLAMIMQVHKKLGHLPRIFRVNADNTVKETKNTVTLFWTCWMLAQCWNTRLHMFEFLYLLVGHTHNSLDQTFAYLGGALRNRDHLSIEEMFEVLQSHMSNPPLWQHLRDIYQWRAAQPSYLASTHIRGISTPHHVRIFKCRDGSIGLQHKRWVTDNMWSPTVCLCRPHQVADLKNLWPEQVKVGWKPGFEASALRFLDKLEKLLVAAGRSVQGLQHCRDVLLHRHPDFLPSGVSLKDKWRLPNIQVDTATKLGRQTKICSTHILLTRQFVFVKKFKQFVILRKYFQPALC